MFMAETMHLHYRQQILFWFVSQEKKTLASKGEIQIITENMLTLNLFTFPEISVVQQEKKEVMCLYFFCVSDI